MLEILIEEAQRFKEIIERMIKTGDQSEFIEYFNFGVEYLGHKQVVEAFELCENLNELMVDLSAECSIAVEIVEDKPGILADIANIFKDQEVNLVIVHSQRKRRHILRFGVEVPLESEEVQKTLSVISEMPSVKLLAA